MCSTVGSVKQNQNHIFQKLLTKKDLRKSAFANTFSRNLFEWLQNLVQNCEEIILSAHMIIMSGQNQARICFFTCGQARRSRDHEMSVRGGGGGVVY